MLVAEKNTTDQITLCFTIGRRPEELRQTLKSLFAFCTFPHVIAINDFGDEASNRAFLEECPHGKLISIGQQLGHHAAVDTMYREVKTPYIFHCEDDWLFTEKPPLETAIKLLHEKSEVSSVNWRKISDFPFIQDDIQKITHHQHAHLAYARLDPLHEQWYGFSFNPNIFKKILWEELGTKGFSQFKKERHISRHFRKKGKYIAFLQDGCCEHIGVISVANPPATGWRACLRSAKLRLKAALDAK